MHQYNNQTEPGKIWGIIPAAGIGLRMGEARPKQYLQLEGKTILEHSIERLLECQRLAGVIVGIASDDQWWPGLTIENNRLCGVYTGGKQRHDTVYKGLQYLSNRIKPNDWVLVHDAVRPCVSNEEIDLLIEKGLASESGAILAAPIVDTVKKLNNNATIQSTVDRNSMMLAMTPQLFPCQLLKAALENAQSAGQLITDESQAVEFFGGKPLAVTGRRSNIKITVRDDLKLARLYLQNR